MKPVRKRLRRASIGDDLYNDLQAAHEVSVAVGLEEASVAVDHGHHRVRDIARGIEHTERHQSRGRPHE